MRKLPPVCLFISLILISARKLRYSSNYIGHILKMEDGSKFEIFRHITRIPMHHHPDDCVFVVSFKFARLSHKANKIVSLVPMLLITGFPGFRTKMYAVNRKNGQWQGIYQWESMQHLEEYQKSFIFKMMNKRAIPETIKSMAMAGKTLTDLLNDQRSNP